MKTNQRTKARVNVSDILPLALTLVVAGIGVAFGLNILSDTQGDFTADTPEYNATRDTITGVGKFSSKFGIIATVIVASIVIGLLVRFLFVR